MIVLNKKMEQIEDSAKAKFTAGVVVTVSDTCDLWLEIWDSSTKHADLIFKFIDFEYSNWRSFQNNIVAWLAECASKVSALHMYTILGMAKEETGKVLANYYMSSTYWKEHNKKL